MSKITCVKVTCSTGKVVLLRELKISDTEKAAERVSVRAGGDQLLLQLYMQKALVQLLVAKIDEKDVTAIQREDVDALFNVKEYSEITKVIGKMMGGDDKGEAKTELVVSD